MASATEKKDDSKWIFILGFWAACAIGAWVLVSNAYHGLRNEIIVFPVRHEGGRIVPMVPVGYRVFPESQRVVTWSDGGLWAPDSMTSCVVRDFKNWQCGTADARMAWMVKGNLTIYPLSDSTFYIGRIRYYAYDWSIFSKKL